MNVLIATGNPGKYKELLEALSPAEGVTYVSLKDYPLNSEAPEDFETCAENALSKAKFGFDQTGMPTMADDSGIFLEAFPDMFGVRTRRQLMSKDDMDWMTQFLELMETVDNRRAKFLCAMAFYDGKTEKVFVGETFGEMVEFPQTPLEPGIPASSIFLPDGFDEVYSAMTKDQKNQVSHRGKACAELKQFLIDYAKSI